MVEVTGKKLVNGWVLLSSCVLKRSVLLLGFDVWLLSVLVANYGLQLQVFLLKIVQLLDQVALRTVGVLASFDV